MPPFPDAVAYSSIERSFGRPLGKVFSSLSDSAVAAASLGQVYKGTLRADGQEVAIKVGCGACGGGRGEAQHTCSAAQTSACHPACFLACCLLPRTAWWPASVPSWRRRNHRCHSVPPAVQVRRPGVLESVTLDLHLMRQVALQVCPTWPRPPARPLPAPTACQPEGGRISRRDRPLPHGPPARSCARCPRYAATGWAS